MSTKKVIQKETYGGRIETLTVEELIQGELDSRSMSYSCSDTTDQSNRIDYLEGVISKLVDALVQSGSLSLLDALELADEGYQESHVQLVDKITE